MNIGLTQAVSDCQIKNNQRRNAGIGFRSIWLQIAELRQRNIGRTAECRTWFRTPYDHPTIAMTGALLRRACFMRAVFALLSFTLLANCIDSAQPILTDAQPFLGERPQLQFYGLHDGAAHEPAVATFAWRDERYVRISGSAEGISDFTLHRFEGPDLIVQSIRPGLPAEYAIARKLADGAYLVVAIDENDADDSTRDAFRGKEEGAACRVTTPQAIFALARATAAKPHATGGLALLLAEP
jgi:hypothetical protein